MPAKYVIRNGLGKEIASAMNKENIKRYATDYLENQKARMYSDPDCERVYVFKEVGSFTIETQPVLRFHGEDL